MTKSVQTTYLPFYQQSELLIVHHDSTDYLHNASQETLELFLLSVDVYIYMHSHHSGTASLTKVRLTNGNFVRIGVCIRTS